MGIADIEALVRAPIVLCAGLPRSGSTWIYNAVLELCKKHGNATGLYTDAFPENFQDLIKSNHTLVIKTHTPSEALCDLVRFVGGKPIISVRDPRDCVVSLMEVFKFEKSAAISSVKHSADAIERLMASQPSSVFVYEDISSRLEAIMQLGNDTGYPVDAVFAQAVSEKLGPEKIRKHVTDLERQGILDSRNAAESYTDETHWHPGHIGDGRTGKYKDTLSEFDIVEIDRNNPLIMQKFNYKTHDVPAIAGDLTLDMSRYARFFAVEGVSFIEDWGVWSEGARTQLDFVFAPHVKSVKFEVHFFLGPSLQGPTPSGQGVVKVNHREVMKIPGLMSPAAEAVLVHTSNPDVNGLITLEFNFDGLKSPEELGINQDSRLLGVGLRRVSCTIVDLMSLGTLATNEFSE
ncbi:sulfotransferase domain-containing protein [Novosphingobium sp. Chol11]|uniref:sulfotransferase domain-containing protein n=1 Tax=Novosphingobium sp. Chol11 TaxID=1385763 RepID=UPI001596F056|nr:sulfotransferase domain-containing protein [Novosphingobium sp. Chol11]